MFRIVRTDATGRREALHGRYATRERADAIVDDLRRIISYYGRADVAYHVDEVNIANMGGAECTSEN